MWVCMCKTRSHSVAKSPCAKSQRTLSHPPHLTPQPGARIRSDSVASCRCAGAREDLIAQRLCPGAKSESNLGCVVPVNVNIPPNPSGVLGCKVPVNVNVPPHPSGGLGCVVPVNVNIPPHLCAQSERPGVCDFRGGAQSDASEGALSDAGALLMLNSALSPAASCGLWMLRSSHSPARFQQTLDPTVPP